MLFSGTLCSLFLGKSCNWGSEHSLKIPQIEFHSPQLLKRNIMVPFSAFSVVQQCSSQCIIGDGNPKLRDTSHPLPPTFTLLSVSRQKSFYHQLKVFCCFFFFTLRCKCLLLCFVFFACSFFLIFFTPKQTLCCNEGVGNSQVIKHENRTLTHRLETWGYEVLWEYRSYYYKITLRCKVAIYYFYLDTF